MQTLGYKEDVQADLYKLQKLDHQQRTVIINHMKNT